MVFLIRSVVTYDSLEKGLMFSLRDYPAKTSRVKNVSFFFLLVYLLECIILIAWPTHTHSPVTIKAKHDFSV